jgi:uncharacterized protein (DUF305 family)
MNTEMQSMTSIQEQASQHRSGKQQWLVGAILLFCLGLLLGGGVMWWMQPKLPGEGSSEVRFARMMSAHHEQAVTMALALYQRSSDPTIRPLALDIILTQRAQIGQMQGWLAVWNQPLAQEPSSMDSMHTMPGMASQQQVNALQTLPVADAEVSFLRLMIRHHQGGVRMAQQELRQTQQPEVVRLATAIVQSQQSEIQAMQEQLRERGVPTS